MKEYFIEVSMTADMENPDAPYPWYILKYEKNKWVEVGIGYAPTSEDAWKEARDNYNQYFKEDNK
jgi:hypothetical protein